MSIEPLITFKAGVCDLDTSQSPPRVIPKPTPGYVYLYEEDDLINFCWRPRSAPMSEPELKLVMVPTDGLFVPYTKSEPEATRRSPTNGRIYVLKFQSGPARHLFWMQSKSQHERGDPSWFSPRDSKIGWIIHRLLQGEQVDTREALANVSNEHGGDGDETMEDVAPEGQGGTQGGAGGSDSQGGGSTGGAAGGSAANAPSEDASIAVQNFLRSMAGNQALGTQPQSQPQQPQSKPFTTLPDLLPPSTTISILATLSPTAIDNLLSHLPPTLLLLSQSGPDISSSADPNPETTKAALEAMSLDQKKEILRKVLRSPQFSQSLMSLTGALRDGGLPTISEALKVRVRDGGYGKRQGGVPLGGGEAVEAFLEGVRGCVEEEGEGEEGGEGRMETD